MADVRIKPWHISLDGPVSEYSESLFAVGNGCLGMRAFSRRRPSVARTIMPCSARGSSSPFVPA